MANGDIKGNREIKVNRYSKDLSPEKADEMFEALAEFVVNYLKERRLKPLDSSSDHLTDNMKKERDLDIP